MTDMKLILTVFVILSALTGVSAQTDPSKNISEDEINKLPRLKKMPKFGGIYESECGSPFAENGGWTELSGSVVEILSGSSFVMTTGRGERKQVTLLANDASDNEPFAREKLAKMILGKEIRVIVGLGEDKPEKLIGRVLVQNGSLIEINGYFLENGIARFKEMPWRSPWELCVDRQLEKKARKNKLGIWAK
ncbi:MAG: thermonuclease family protein [Acidobacteria bacterium]|nr:thermonuclease family protein [Acidobacteriota bacterium]